MEATRSVYRLFAWYLMSIREHPGCWTTVTTVTQLASQGAREPGDNEKWDLGNWQQPRPPPERGREIREISCEMRERRQEANKNTFIFQSDDYSSLQSPVVVCIIIIIVVVICLYLLSCLVVGGVRSAGPPIRQSDVMVVLSWYYRHYASLFFTMLD